MTNGRMRELEPQELQAVVGGAVYGVTATMFRLPGRSTADGLAAPAPAQTFEPAARRWAS
ncbi:MAG: hypothetical protein U1E60_14270 [Reyranellaceae bacterium]